jgi:CelD/BcsL family acetyltransferase involved in cellulose biosynthesis
MARNKVGHRVEVFQGRSGLDALADEWRALFDALERPSYAQLWEWHRSYLETLAPDPEAVRYCALHDGEGLVAILPLAFAEESIMGLRVQVASLPQHDHLRLGDILVHPRALPGFDLARTLAAVRRRIRRPWDITRLGPTTEDSAATAAVGAVGPTVLRLTEPLGVSDALEAGPYEALQDRLSKNFRAALRKARNKLARLENVSAVWARTPEEVEAAYARFVEVEASGWKGQAGAGTAIGLDPEMCGFFGDLSRRLAASGHGRINLLLHGDKVMAGQFGIVAGERYFLLKIGYDETYRGEAPGNLLLERLLQEVADDPAIRYVDLVSAATWHQSWKPVQRQVLMHRLFHPTPLGAAAWAALRGKQLLRPLARDLRRRAQFIETRLRPPAPVAASQPA